MTKILLLNDRGPWIAMCLQHYLVAQAETPTKALEALTWTYWTQVLLDKHNGVEPLSRIEQAPDGYWARFDKGIPFARRFKLRALFPIDHEEPVAEVRQ